MQGSCSPAFHAILPAMPALAGFARIARALRTPNYRIYVAGNSVSLIGTWMQRVAVGWLTWQLMESGAWLGAMAFADLFPTVVIGPFAGAAADRWDRRRALRLGQSIMLAQALVLFALTASGLITIWLLLALTLFNGVVIAFNQPTRLALIPSLVVRDDLPAAVATNSIIFNSARFLGPAAAGVVIVAGGVAAAFAANAACTAALVLALTRIRLAPEEGRRAPGRGGLLAEVAEGLGYAVRHPGIAPLLLLLLATGLCARPFVELLPGFADAIFDAGAEGLAAMTSTVGLGAIAGGLWLARRDARRGLTPVALAGPLVLALALAGFVSSGRLWLALPALAIAGFAMVAGGVGTQTLLQLAVEGRLRGRVLALYGLIFRGGPALGALAMGALSEVFGLRLPLAAGACLAALAGIAAWTRRSAIATALEPPESEVGLEGARGA
jgi:predicted MFS family arabinose efflux permease